MRRLAREGQLPARRIGAVWLIDGTGVERRRDLEPSAGRPLSPLMAWAVLTAVDAALAADPAAIRSATVADAVPLGDRKARYRLRQLLTGAPPVSGWGSWLRRRAAPRPICIHPGVLDRLATDRRVRPGGASAVVAAGLGVTVAAASSLFYIDAQYVDAVVRKYRGRDKPDGPVTLMVIPASVPTELRPRPGVAIPPGAALVDLLAAPDARERHLATELLGRASARLAGVRPP